MAQDFSFDIVCDYDKQEFTNALDQTRREMTNRYDFKNVLADLELSGKDLIIHTESEPKLAAIFDILESKMVKRNLPLSILDKSARPEDAANSTIRMRVKLVDTLTTEQAKEIAKQIRENNPKVKPIIQGDSVRVTSKSKDDLQEVMTLVKSLNEKLPIQFTNYR